MIKGQSLPQTVLIWGLFALVFCIPVSQWLTARILLVVLAMSLFVRPFNIQLLFYRAWDIGLYLLTLIIGLLYTTDLDLGLRVLETSFSLFAIPIVFSKLPAVDDKFFNRLYLAFASGLVVAGLVAVSNAVYRYTSSHEINVFFFYNFTEIIGSHPTYFAYFLIFGLTIALYRLYYEAPVVSRRGTLFLVIFFFVVLALTGGSTAFVSLLLIGSFFILKFTLEPATKSKKIVLVLVCFMLVILFMMSSADYWYEQLASENDYWERSQLWRSAIFANTNPVFGVGTGDYMMVLNRYYMAHGLGEFAESSFNSHNQFIQVYLSNGFVGLFAIVLMLGKPLYLALKERFPLGILIFFPVIIYGMNEVFLGRFQGVVFFALIHQLLIAYYGSTNSVAALKARQN